MASYMVCPSKQLNLCLFQNDLEVAFIIDLNIHHFQGHAEGHTSLSEAAHGVITNQ